MFRIDGTSMVLYPKILRQNKKVLLWKRKRHTAHRVASPWGEYLPWLDGVPTWGTYLGRGVPTLVGGTYLGGRVPTLVRGYLPWLEGTHLGPEGVPTLAQVVPTLAGGYLPWPGVPTLARGGVPTLAEMRYTPVLTDRHLWKHNVLSY